MPDFLVASSYGRGIRESTNGGSGRSMSNPDHLLYDDPIRHKVFFITFSV